MSWSTEEPWPCHETCSSDVPQDHQGYKRARGISDMAQNQSSIKEKENYHTRKEPVLLEYRGETEPKKGKSYLPPPERVPSHHFKVQSQEREGRRGQFRVSGGF